MIGKLILFGAPAFKVLQHKSFFGGIQGFAFLNLQGTQSPEELEDDVLFTKGILQPSH